MPDRETKLLLGRHSIPGHEENWVTEVWHAGRMVAVIYPLADRAGVNIVSRHPLSAVPGAGSFIVRVEVP